MTYYLNKKERQPETFVGNVVNHLGGNQDLVNLADIISSVTLLTPYGFIPASLDLGMDTSKYVHDPSKDNLKDIGLDVLSMMPFVNKPGLKSAGSFLDFLQNNRTYINLPLTISRFLDFENDTPKVKKVKLTDKGMLSAQKKE